VKNQILFEFFQAAAYLRHEMAKIVKTEWKAKEIIRFLFFPE